MILKTFRRWERHSLANAIALQASIIAICSGLLVAAISLGVIYWVEIKAEHKSLQEKAVHLTESLEQIIIAAESTVSDLAKSPIVTTAILDSTGREAYVVPFINNFTIPIQAASGLALCDINGVRLAGTRINSLSDCRAKSPHFKQALLDGKPIRELASLKNGHLAWTVYQGVVFPYTGTIEGIIVMQLDLNDILSHIPTNFDVDGVTLSRANSAEILISKGQVKAGNESAKSTLFKGTSNVTPISVDVTVWKYLSPFKDKLAALVLSYVIGIFLLVLGVIVGTHRASLRLIRSLVGLTGIARKIAETGNMYIEIPLMKYGELGQLSSAFETMVNTIRNSEENLEAQVLLRTQELQKVEASLRSIFNAATGVALIAVDTQGIITLFNPGAERLLGYQAAEVIGNKTILQYCLQEELNAKAKVLAKVEGRIVTGMELLRAQFDADGIIATDWTWVRKNGEYCAVRVSVTIVFDEADVAKGYFIVAEDVTNQKLAEVNLRIAATAFESQEGMIVTDANNHILRVNSAFTTITGYRSEDVVGQTPSLLSSGRQDKAFYTEMWERLNQTGAWEGEIWNRRKNGEVYPEHLTITAVKDSSGVVTNYVATLTDITMSKAASDEIKNLAFYDPLTRLPNRRLLMDRLQQALAASTRSGQRGALLFLDLDHFKTLNDTLGHDVGDLLLQQVATRLSNCVREGDTVARLGGDEFVVLLEDLSEQPIEAAAHTEAIAQKILIALNQPYQLGTHEHRSTPSVGATLFNDHEAGLEAILKQADIAMYQSKMEGRNTLRFFDPKMQDAITIRVDMEYELRQAIAQQQFKLYYQIQVDHTGHPLGAEALIRWSHPVRNMIPPTQFIPLAEETGLILPIGQWVLETACAQLKKWHQNRHSRDLVLSVNVSAKQFHQVNFVTQVKEMIQRHGIDPTKLKLELTESMLVKDVDDIVEKMNALSQIGVRFSLDDFGTGYSSLQYLKKLPLSQLKIDQSFVRDIVTNESDLTIVSTIIAMAHSLNLSVIAEGVETEDQRQCLLGKDCTNLQGYLFGKPVPIDEFENFLKKIALI